MLFTKNTQNTVLDAIFHSIPDGWATYTTTMNSKAKMDCVTMILTPTPISYLQVAQFCLGQHFSFPQNGKDELTNFKEFAMSLVQEKIKVWAADLHFKFVRTISFQDLQSMNTAVLWVFCGGKDVQVSYRRYIMSPALMLTDLFHASKLIHSIHEEQLPPSNAFIPTSAIATPLADALFSDEFFSDQCNPNLHFKSSNFIQMNGAWTFSQMKGNTKSSEQSLWSCLASFYLISKCENHKQLFSRFLEMNYNSQTNSFQNLLITCTFRARIARHYSVISLPECSCTWISSGITGTSISREELEDCEFESKHTFLCNTLEELIHTLVASQCYGIVELSFQIVSDDIDETTTVNLHENMMMLVQPISANKMMMRPIKSRLFSTKKIENIHESTIDDTRYLSTYKNTLVELMADQQNLNQDYKDDESWRRSSARITKLWQVLQLASYTINASPKKTPMPFFHSTTPLGKQHIHPFSWMQPRSLDPWTSQIRFFDTSLHKLITNVEEDFKSSSNYSQKKVFSRYRERSAHLTKLLRDSAFYLLKMLQADSTNILSNQESVQRDFSRVNSDKNFVSSEKIRSPSELKLQENILDESSNILEKGRFKQVKDKDEHILSNKSDTIDLVSQFPFPEVARECISPQQDSSKLQMGTKEACTKNTSNFVSQESYLSGSSKLMDEKTSVETKSAICESDKKSPACVEDSLDLKSHSEQTDGITSPKCDLKNISDPKKSQTFNWQSIERATNILTRSINRLYNANQHFKSDTTKTQSKIQKLFELVVAAQQSSLRVGLMSCSNLKDMVNQSQQVFLQTALNRERTDSLQSLLSSHPKLMDVVQM